MNRVTHSLAIIGAAVSAPVWAASLPAITSAQPVPSITAGSASLMPLMAAEMEANHLPQIDAGANGGGAQSIDDITFVRQATDSGRQEVQSARDALPQLKQPELKRLAEMLVVDHSGATARLARIAEAKGWLVPGPKASAQPDKGTASADFDSTWTAEMIAGHERSAALYRAQAQRGEDADLRQYARETLPTIERHLAELRHLQK